MASRSDLLIGLLILLSIGLYWLFGVPSVAENTLPSSDQNLQKGEYLVNAGGCISCHEGVSTEGLSGGLALESDFGIFFVPNITPDLNTGIGTWSAKDFLLAMKHGRSPGGSFYFPAFPYRAYAGMTDEDVLDVAAYLMAQTSVVNAVPSHETPFWLQRWMLAIWNKAADYPGQRIVESESTTQIERGAYLARNLGHCGECHTPRNFAGMSLNSREFEGATMGESHADAIDSEALALWSEEDFSFFLFLGMKPDGEFVGGEMEGVIEHNTAKLTDEDRQAIAAFFKQAL